VTVTGVPDGHAGLVQAVLSAPMRFTPRTHVKLSAGIGRFGVYGAGEIGLDCPMETVAVALRDLITLAARQPCLTVVTFTDRGQDEPSSSITYDPRGRRRRDA